MHTNSCLDARPIVRFIATLDDENDAETLQRALERLLIGCVAQYLERDFAPRPAGAADGAESVGSGIISP